MQRLRMLDPGVARYVFLVDNVDDYFDPAEESFHVVLPEQYVDPPVLRQLAFQYTAFELSNALKGFAHRYMFRRTSCDDWVYFDSDIYPISSCKSVFEQHEGYRDSSVFMTPHILKACSASRVWLEALFLRHGIYNGGWLGIRRSVDAEAFIDWFILRVRTHAFNHYRYSFTDQLWLNLAPLI